MGTSPGTCVCVCSASSSTVCPESGRFWSPSPWVLPPPSRCSAGLTRWPGLNSWPTSLWAPAFLDAALSSQSELGNATCAVSPQCWHVSHGFPIACRPFGRTAGYPGLSPCSSHPATPVGASCLPRVCTHVSVLLDSGFCSGVLSIIRALAARAGLRGTNQTPSLSSVCPWRCHWKVVFPCPQRLWFCLRLMWTLDCAHYL